MERGPNTGRRFDDNDNMPASEHGPAVAGCDHDGAAVGKVRLVSRDEIDLAGRVWTVPRPAGGRTPDLRRSGPLGCTVGGLAGWYHRSIM